MAKVMSFLGRSTHAGIVATIVSGIFAVEGGYTNDPHDPGGATNHGVTQHVARENGYTGDMRFLSEGQAYSIYERQYIDKPGFGLMIDEQPAVAYKLINAGVNVGPKNAAIWFQNAVNAFSNNQIYYRNVQVDGKVGPATLRAYQELVQRRGKVEACELTIKLIDAQQLGYYARLGMWNYFTGWTNSRIGNVPFSWCSHFPSEITQ